MSVAIDTMIVIWSLGKPHKGAKKTSRQKFAEMRRRSCILLETLAEASETVIVPTPAVSELLVGIESAKHGTFIAELQQRFFLPPFDIHASALAADLWQKHRKLPKEDQSERPRLKMDVLIVATAKVAGAVKFYSHDAKCRSLAHLAGMEAHDLPSHSEDLYINEKYRKQEESESAE